MFYHADKFYLISYVRLGNIRIDFFQMRKSEFMP